MGKRISKGTKGTKGNVDTGATVEGSAAPDVALDSVPSVPASTFSKSDVLAVWDAINRNYIARERASGRIPVLRAAKGTFQSDVAQGRAIISNMSDEQIASLSALGVTVAVLKALETAPVKVAKRLPGLFMFHCTKLGRWAMLARTFVLLTCGLATGVVSRDGLVFCTTGAGNESTSDEVPSIKRARDNMRALGRVGVSTFATQYSSAYGKNGIGVAFGLTCPHAKNIAPVIDTAHPTVRAVVDAVAMLTQSDVADIRAKLETSAGAGEGE